MMAIMMSRLASRIYSLRGRVQTIIRRLSDVAAKLSAALAGMQIGQVIVNFVSRHLEQLHPAAEIVRGLMIASKGREPRYVRYRTAPDPQA